MFELEKPLDIRSYEPNSHRMLKSACHPVALLLVFFLGFCPLSSVAQQSKSKPVASAAAPTEKQARPIPFHGTIAAVNPVAQTITVGKRTFVVTVDSKLYKNDKTVAGAWKDAVIGGAITGSYVKASDGKLIARSVYFKPSAASAVQAGTAPASVAKPSSAGR